MSKVNVADWELSVRDFRSLFVLLSEFDSPPCNAVSNSVIYELLLAEGRLTEIFVLDSTDIDFIIKYLSVA